MKKLLSILGILVVTASTSTAVVACSKPNNGNNNITEEEDTNNPDLDNSYAQDSMSKLISQYAKTLYLNQNGLESNSELHYSSQAYMDSNVIGSRLSTLGLNDFNKGENVNNSTRFSDIADKYFDKKIFSDNDLTLSENIYQGKVFDPNRTSESELTAALKDTVPLVLGFLSEPESLIPFLPMVSELLTPEILVTLKDVLTQENLQLLESAFSVKIYEGMNYQTSLDSSVIGLSNALDKMLNGDSHTKLDYSTIELIEKNIDKANETLATNVLALIKEEKKLEIDLLSNIDSLAEIIRFVRTLLVYTNQFSFEEMTSSVLTLQKIEEKRSAIFSKNSVDVKLSFQKLSAMIDDDKGTVFKNYIGILLATNSTNFPTGKDFKENVNDGLMGLVSKIAVAELGEKISDDRLANAITGGPIWTNTFVRSFINGGLNSADGGQSFNQIMPALTNKLVIIFIPSPVKEILQSIDRAGDMPKFKSDWIGYLWNESDETLGFSVRGLLTTPVNEIDLSEILGFSSAKNENTKFAQSYGLNSSTVDLSQYYLNGKSIKDVVDQFNTAFSGITGVSSINFSDISDLARLLHTENLIGKALENPEEMMAELGLNSDDVDQPFVPGSPLEKLFDILKDFKEIAQKLDEVINVWNDESDRQINAIKSEAVSVFKLLKVTTEIVDENVFKYVVTNGTISNTFTINLKNVNDKFLISSITLV